MQEEVTIKINTVMGSTKGYDDAAKYAQKAMGQAAQQGGAQVAQQFESGIGSFIKKQQGGGSSGSKKALGMLEGVASNVAGGNAMGLIGMLGKLGGSAAIATALVNIGQQIGVTNTMSNAGLSGGNGLRGHGLYGSIMGVKDWFTGRSTREGMEDLQVGQNDFIRGQLTARLGTDTDVAMRRAGVAFNPLTEADPFERARQERAQLQARADDMRARRELAARRAENHSAALRRAQYIDINTGHNISKEAAQLQQAEMQKQAQQFADAGEQITQQQRDFEFGQLGQRKAVLFQGKQAWGQTLPGERTHIVNILQKMRAGQRVGPTELAVARSQGWAQETVNKYLEEQADDASIGGPSFSEALAAGGDKTYAEAARRQIQVGGKIEHYLDEQKLAQQKQALLKDVDEAGNKIRQDIQQTLERAGFNANVRVTDRGLIDDRTQLGAR